MSYYDLPGIITFVSIVCTAGNIIFSWVTFYTNPSEPTCTQPLYYWLSPICSEELLISRLFIGLIIGLLYAGLAILFIYYIFWSSCERKLEYKIRCLTKQEKKDLFKLVENHHWRYSEAKKEIEAMINSLISE